MQGWVPHPALGRDTSAPTHAASLRSPFDGHFTTNICFGESAVLATWIIRSENQGVLADLTWSRRRRKRWCRDYSLHVHGCATEPIQGSSREDLLHSMLPGGSCCSTIQDLAPSLTPGRDSGRASRQESALFLARSTVPSLARRATRLPLAATRYTTLCFTPPS